MQSTGARLLRELLQTRGLTQSDAARAIGVSAPTIHDWVTSAKRPRAAHREAIEVWTAGAVPASAWETEEERALLARVRPLHPATTASPEE